MQLTLATLASNPTDGCASNKATGLRQQESQFREKNTRRAGRGGETDPKFKGKENFTSAGLQGTVPPGENFTSAGLQGTVPAGAKEKQQWTAPSQQAHAVYSQSARCGSSPLARGTREACLGKHARKRARCPERRKEGGRRRAGEQRRPEPAAPVYNRPPLRVPPGTVRALSSRGTNLSV